MPKLVEPQLHRVCNRYKARNLNPERRGNEKTDDAAWHLFHTIEPLLPQNQEGTFRAIWFSLERGDIEAWLPFNELADYLDDEYCGVEGAPKANSETWKREWLERYPKETYWHELEVVHDIVRGEPWLVIAIDNETICEAFPEDNPYERDFKQMRYEAPDLDQALMGLADTVERAIKTVADGNYANTIERDLPFDLRYGLIQRSSFWKATNNEGRLGCNELSQHETSLLVKALRQQPKQDNLSTLPKLTTKEYFDALREGYKMCGYELEADRHRGSWLGIPADDSRQWYMRFGDARDDTLLTIDPDSPSEFERWYEEKKGHTDHNFEIFAGRGCNRVHMNPHMAESGGWRLVIWGSITAHATDMARMWKHMNDSGFPTYLYDADQVADAIAGDDYILIVPRHKSYDYVRGEHFGREISTALPLWDKFRDAITAATEWQPVKVAELGKSQLAP